MKNFRILINGQNFLVKLEGSPEYMGFYTTRFVVAEDPDEAELKAVQTIRDDSRFKELEVLNAKESDKKPMIYAEEIYEIEASEMENNQGFAWYAMEEA